MAGKKLLRVEGLSKKYGTADALKNISFDLERGEVLGLFGLNGSGKSTLLDIVALAKRPDSGHIFLNGAEVSYGSGAARRSIGYVPQEIALFEELTVRENLLCWSRLSGQKAKLRVGETAERLNLLSFYNKKVSALSGGMKRRVNLAVALLGDPELLVLDEPFAGVDTDNTGWIEQLLREMADSGIAIIVSGHSAEQMMPLLDRILVLSSTGIIWHGDKASFLMGAETAGINRKMQSIIRGETP
ncbi:MAG: ABC transporter ATP-binding protein [Oscillospiraceae bacterium]|nr:ABC transporter ATP-binding protein [Oscillospiraceae bacterium]